MAAKICNIPKGYCKICPNYKKSFERNDMACFAKTQVINPTLSDYTNAIKNNEIEIAQEMYPMIFKK